MTGALDLDELAASVPVVDVAAISLRLIERRLGVSAAVYDENGQLDRSRGR